MEGQLLFFIILVASSGLALAQNTSPCYNKWWGEIVAHPTVCYKFYVCILTLPSERTCASNAVFNPTKKQCVLGNQKTCEIYGAPTFPPTHPTDTEPTWTQHTETETPEPETENPTTRQPETYPPTTREPESDPPTTREPETDPPTTREPETDPPTTREPETDPTTEPQTTRESETDPTTRTTRNRTTRTRTTRTRSTTPETTSTTPLPPPSLPDICRGIFFASRPFPGSNEYFVGCVRGNGAVFQCQRDEFYSYIRNECLTITYQ